MSLLTLDTDSPIFRASDDIDTSKRQDLTPTADDRNRGLTSTADPS